MNDAKVIADAGDSLMITGSAAYLVEVGKCVLTDSGELLVITGVTHAGPGEALIAVEKRNG